MRVALGVNIGRCEATIAILDAAVPHRTIGQSRVDLADDSTSALRSAVLTTVGLLTHSGRHLASTRICSADPERASRLAEALIDSRLDDVAVIPESSAMAKMAKSLSGGKPVAVVAADTDTASLCLIDEDSTSLIAVESFAETDRLDAYSRLLTRFRDAPGAATSVIVLDPSTDPVTTDRLMGQSPVPLVAPHAPGFAIARGAALAASAPLTEATETTVRPHGQGLAYSEVDDVENTGGFLGADETPSALQETSTEAQEAGRRPDVEGPKFAVWASALAAFAIAGFAALAVIVAVSMRPEPTQQAVRAQKEAVPGKFFPMAPGQGTRPDGDNWAVVEKLPPQGQPADFRVFEPVAMRPSLAVESAPIELKLFSDGTLGLGSGFDPAAYLPPITIGATPGVAGPAGITGMDLVARLVPDFSSVDMTQVIVSLINNVAEADVLGTMAATLVSLNNAGSIGIVRSDQMAIRTGEPIAVLSDPPSTILAKVNAGGPVTALAAAPTVIAPLTPDVSNVRQSTVGEDSPKPTAPQPSAPAPAEASPASAVTGPPRTSATSPDAGAEKDAPTAVATTAPNPGPTVSTSSPDTADPVSPPDSAAESQPVPVQTPVPVPTVPAPTVPAPTVVDPPAAAVPAPVPTPTVPPAVVEAPAPSAVVDVPAPVEPVSPPTTTLLPAPSTAES